MRRSIGQLLFVRQSVLSATKARIFSSAAGEIERDEPQQWSQLQSAKAGARQLDNDDTRQELLKPLRFNRIRQVGWRTACTR